MKLAEAWAIVHIIDGEILCGVFGPRQKIFNGYVRQPEHWGQRVVQLVERDAAAELKTSDALAEAINWLEHHGATGSGSETEEGLVELLTNLRAAKKHQTDRIKLLQANVSKSRGRKK